MFKNFDWEDAWLFLLYAFCFFLIVSFGTCSFHKKYVKHYSLGGSDGFLTITKEIEWDLDENIKLDRSVSYSDAIQMIDSLNKTLKP